MREIKFRAWDTKRNEIVYFDLNLCNDESRRWYDEQIHNNDIMQYTGLKDKNGVEIYEWDILEHIPKNECNYIVKYVTSGFYICPNNENYGEYFTSLFAGFNGKDTCSSLEVIGNIYENKELLGD